MAKLRVGLLFGGLIGYVSTRRAGTTFAMISLGFGEMVTALTLILVAVFNGEDGIQTDRIVGPEPLGRPGEEQVLGRRRRPPGLWRCRGGWPRPGS